MTSRELVDELLGIVTQTNPDGDQIVLVEASFLPERSAFNTALRGGDSSPTEYREGRIINELAAANAAGRGYEPWLSHGQKAAEKEHEDWQKRRHDENLKQLRGEG
jgi:hypothetical protein